MRCPIDNTPLTITHRSGVEIDYCPNCRGVWLDRGELDKLIERSGAYDQPHRGQPQAQPPTSYTSQPSHTRHHPGGHAPYGQQPYYGGSDYHPHYKKKKRKDFLEEIFDFD